MGRRLLVFASIVSLLLLCGMFATDAQSKTFLVLKHKPGALSPRLYAPQVLPIAPYYGAEGIVQRTTWKRWGNTTAQGLGQIRTRVGDQLEAHVTLTATDVGPYFRYQCGFDRRADQNPPAEPVKSGETAWW
jgi:hypothetical protein